MQPNNVIVISGRLTATPEVKKPNDKSICNFTVAVNRPKINGESKTDFIPCVAFGVTADTIGKYFQKGNRISVMGELNINRFTDKEGNSREKATVVVSAFNFVDSSTSSSEKENKPENETKKSNKVSKKEYEEVVSDADLPF